MLKLCGFTRSPMEIGRTTRLLADLVFTAAQEHVDMQYDWNLDNKQRYIDLLREFDKHRDPSELAAFIDVQEIDD